MKSTPVRRTRRKSRGSTRAFIRQAGAAQPAFFAGSESAAQRKCEDCAGETETVQRKEAAGTPAGPARSTSRYIQSLAGRGEPLSTPVRSFFEARTGANLGSVRVHRDAEAAQSASALHAQAYTVGDHVVFNRGKFAPETGDGRKLLSHELVHVLQQRYQARSGLRVQMMPEETKAPASDKKEPTPIGESATAAPEKDAAVKPPGADAAKSQEHAAEKEGEKLAAPMQIADFATFGKPSVHTDFAKFVTFNGKTDATFDGGVGQTKNLKATPGKDCSGCAPGECVHVTGTLQINYHVSTTVTLPDVPSGLTPCQEKRVAEAINNKIKPHEAQHVTAFSTYNGTVNLPINYTGCKSGLNDHVQAMHDAHSSAREAAARAQSAALDPFNVSVNLDCEDAPPKK